MNNSLFEQLGLQEMTRLMGRAVERAAEENRAANVPVAVKVGGVWMRQFSDGTTEPVSADRARPVSEHGGITPARARPSRSHTA